MKKILIKIGDFIDKNSTIIWLIELVIVIIAFTILYYTH